MKIGVLVNLTDADIKSKFMQVKECGFDVCQLCCWEQSLMTDEIADKVLECCERYGVRISTFWCGWSGPAVWDFYEGPLTLGIVPEGYRFIRMKELMHGSDFAKKLGVKNIATHVGFLPENLESERYRAVVSALKTVANHAKDNGQYFLFETGQETPVTLRRTIEDMGTGNVGINLDPANLVMYGKANPIDALDVFGEYVRDVHAKDGCYPTDGRHLGVEKPLGEGVVNFPLFIERLKDMGYDGTLIIEREISGEEQIKDIKNAKVYLGGLIQK